MNPKFVYVFDSLCSWCYAFHPQLLKVIEHYSSYDLRLVSGGMFIGPNRKHALDLISPSEVKTMYDRVKEIGKANISDKYINDLVLKDNYYLDSERTSKGLAVFRTYQHGPVKELEYIERTQIQMYVDGVNPNADAYFTNVLPHFGIENEHEFLVSLKEAGIEQEARSDYQYAQQLQVDAYPQLFLQTGETDYYLIAKGYTESDQVIKTVEAVLKEINDQ